MLYSVSDTVPANTAMGAHSEIKIALMHGVITKVIFRPRPGHASLLHVKVFHRRHQIFPSSGDDDLHGDSFPIEWDEWYEIKEKPFFLEIVAWNEDDTYPHGYDLAVACIPMYAALPFVMLRLVSDLVAALSPKRIAIPTWLGGKKG